MTLLAFFIGLVFLYSLFSQRLDRTAVTAPIVFAAGGILAFFVLPDVQQRAGAEKLLLRVAEVGLVLLLFTDASRTNLAVLKKARTFPMRLLSTGMLLTIGMGMLAAFVVFRGLSVWEAGILAAILAPTDAGLGQVIIADKRVPPKLREALLTEAGLNDGLAVPFLLFFIALAASGYSGNEGALARFMVEQLGVGALIGIGVGLAGGALLRLAHTRGWMAAWWQKLAVVTLPLVCIVLSHSTGASMFIAAFIAGMTVQRGYHDAGKHSVEFAEEWGQLLNLSVFFLFGLLMAQVAPELRPSHFLYAALSLTVVRMVPVVLALLGTGLSRISVLFLGWFGPRGLASIVLGLVYLHHEASLPGEATIRLAVMATVMTSIVAHGLTARPGVRLYARGVKSLPSGAPENDAAA